MSNKIYDSFTGMIVEKGEESEYQKQYASIKSKDESSAFEEYSKELKVVEDHAKELKKHSDKVSEEIWKLERRVNSEKRLTKEEKWELSRIISSINRTYVI